MKPIKIFLCYSDEDADLVRRLKDHLEPLVSSGKVEIWSYQRVFSLINIDWQQEFEYQFNTANIILLLGSLDFLASDRCYHVEAREALEKYKAGKARVIHVALKPVFDPAGQPILRDLPVLPSNGLSVTEWKNRHEAFQHVYEGILAVVEELEDASGS
jgi:hypothetical protein